MVYFVECGLCFSRRYLGRQVYTCMMYGVRNTEYIINSRSRVAPDAITHPCTTCRRRAGLFNGWQKGAVSVRGGDSKNVPCDCPRCGK